jgi:N-acetylmuramoyl-L-alanine amidase
MDPEEETEIPDGETPQPVDQYMLCIDPGHYGGANAVTGNGSYGYAEGDVTLQLAARLQEILWDTYGVDSYLTRESEHITLNGLTDKALDSRSIYLRGAYASLYQCDLFISLHTNANAANANGYPQFDQPESINKPMVILNETAVDSELAKRTALAVGKNLAEVYRTHNLYGSDFDESTFENVPEWTGTYNDGLGYPGKIVRRTGQPKEGSNDYYGVLRGSANEDIPGMIIEHGYHSVKEIRRLAIEGNLIEEWAKADARGIAEGLGLEPLPS